jgi:HK97 family phage portal protein
VLRRLLNQWLVGPWSSTILSDAPRSVPYVTAATALRYTPVYRAVTLIAGDIARMELEVSSPGAASLLASPSTIMNAFDLKRAMTMQVLLYGNAFAAINRTRGGELLELIMLDAETVQLDVSGARPFYKTKAYGDLELEQMFHLRAPSTSGIWGQSPIDLCRTSLQIMAAQEQMALKAYENAGNPKIAIVHPSKLSGEAMQRIERDYVERHSGSLNAGRPLVLMEGAKVERISSTLDDTGLEKARGYSIEDVSRIYGVPSLYLGMAGGGNAYGSLEWTGRQYVDGCLRTWISAWTSEIKAKLTGPTETVLFDVDDLQRPGMAETMAALRTAVEAGFMTRNEAREELDLPPLPGLDEPTLALNVGTGGGQTNLGDDTSAQEGTPNDF